MDINIETRIYNTIDEIIGLLYCLEIDEHKKTDNKKTIIGNDISFFVNKFENLSISGLHKINVDIKYNQKITKCINNFFELNS
jgi:hypothetical protein